MGVIRPFLFCLAVGSMLLGAVGVLSPGVSTLLWLGSAILLAGHPASPVLRAIGNLMVGEDHRAPARQHQPL